MTWAFEYASFLTDVILPHAFMTGDGSFVVAESQILAAYLLMNGSMTMDISAAPTTDV